MANQNDQEKEDMRIMWLASGVIVLIILGLMGVSMLGDANTSTNATDLSSQSRTAPHQ